MTSFYANQNQTSTPNPDWSLDFYDSIPASRAGLPQALLPSVQDIEKLDPPQEQPLATLLANLLIPCPPHCGDDATLTAGLLDELAHPDEFPSLPSGTVQPFTAGWTLAPQEVQQAFSFRRAYDNLLNSFTSRPPAVSLAPPAVVDLSMSATGIENSEDRPLAGSGRASAVADHEHDIKSIKDVANSGDAKNAEVSDIPVEEDDYPDGGLAAWLVIIGAKALAAEMSTFGYVNAWGAYYETVLLEGTSPSTIAWIGSVQYALCFLPCIIFGRLFDLGYFKSFFGAASILLVVATFLIAECTTYWQLLLCQGIALGLSCGAVFGPVVSIVSQWFKKKRGIALGINACGSSIGGTIFPIMFRNLQTEVGYALRYALVALSFIFNFRRFKWTMRIFGFLLMFTLGFANLTLRRRLPPVNVTGGLFNFSVWKNPAFLVYTVSGLVSFLGLYTVLTYIGASGPTQGLTDNYSFYLVVIANAASGFGRLTSGVIADRIGPINIMTPMMAFTGIFTYIWPFVHGTAAVTIIAIFYGYASGAYIGLCPAPMINFGEPGDSGRRIGMYFTTMAFGAVAGPPISGAINNATGSDKPVGIYAGSAIMVSVVGMYLTRYFALKGYEKKSR
ncbi:hypothetical protein EWM64_g2605 [Hericium alpestre]|uniref:Major facilitator superfamily (MFS) profile domain-containing protein n=1 Tax=Hericium alpestre TaxID=135208 RepID=A0A4Z0A4M4_9AGAM|nr:hypothetical protein EWM64_g2605 [Hericium alpestre]